MVLEIAFCENGLLQNDQCMQTNMALKVKFLCKLFVTKLNRCKVSLPRAV
jgi:hypothetical protein